MAVSFACPVCRTRIAPPEHGPILKVRCPECATLVELPYLRRRDTERRRKSGGGWAWVAIVLALAVLTSVGTYITVRARIRAERQQVFEDLIQAAGEDEHADRLSVAINRLRTAIQMGTGERFATPARLTELEERLKRLEHKHEAARVRDIETRARADMTVAAALDARNDPDLLKILELCEASYALAKQADTSTTRQIQEDAKSLASRLIRSRGLVFDAPAGTFLATPASGDAHAKRIEPIVGAHLRAHGYLPRRDDSPLRALWDELAPFRLRTRVDEAHAGTYLDSALRTVRIDLTLDLVQGNRSLWKNRVTSKSRVPSPRMSAFQSRILAAARRPNPELEQILYEDAVAHLVELLPSRLTSLPDWQPPA